MSLSGVNKGTAAAPVRPCQGERWPSCAQQEGLCSMSSNTCVSAITAGHRHRWFLHFLRRYISLDGCHRLWLDDAPFWSIFLFGDWIHEASELQRAGRGTGGAMSNTLLFHLLPLQRCFWVCSPPPPGDDQPIWGRGGTKVIHTKVIVYITRVYRALIQGSGFTKFQIGTPHLFIWEPFESLSERSGLQFYTMCFPLWSGRTVYLKTMFKSSCLLKLTNTPRCDFLLGIKPVTQAALIPSFPISVFFFSPLSTHLSFLRFF